MLHVKSCLAVGRQSECLQSLQPQHPHASSCPAGNRLQRLPPVKYTSGKSETATQTSSIKIPKSIGDVDNGKILGFGADLSEDHPVSITNCCVKLGSSACHELGENCAHSLHLALAHLQWSSMWAITWYCQVCLQCLDEYVGVLLV